MKMTDFWDTAPCSLVEIHRCFRGAYCLHHRVTPPSIRARPHGTISPKIIVFMLPVLSTSHLSQSWDWSFVDCLIHIQEIFGPYLAWSQLCRLRCVMVSLSLSKPLLTLVHLKYTTFFLTLLQIRICHESAISYCRLHNYSNFFNVVN
jgi:hypothetical protein